MPYVKRDASGAIVAARHEPTEDIAEELAIEDAELRRFLDGVVLHDLAMREWIESDLGLARVLEDVVDVLIEKGVIRFTDLPDAAQDKLMKRRGLRSRFSYVESLFAEDDGDFGDSADEGGYL